MKSIFKEEIMDQQILYKKLDELESTNESFAFIKKVIHSRKVNIEKSKQILLKNKINIRKIEKELDNVAQEIAKQKDYNISKQLSNIKKILINEIKDKDIPKVVVLNMLVYVINFLITNAFKIALTKLKIPYPKKVSELITGLIVSPITDELEHVISIKYNLKTSDSLKYGSRFMSALLHKTINKSNHSNNQSAILLTGIGVNKVRSSLKVLNIPYVKTIQLEVKSLMYTSYLIVLNIVESLKELFNIVENK